MQLTVRDVNVSATRRPRPWGLLLGAAAVVLTSGLCLALIWDRVPTDSANWPGAADRAGARARDQALAEQAAEAWSQVLANGLVCGGDMAVASAGERTASGALASDFTQRAATLRPIAERCRERLPSLREVWLVPTAGRADQAYAVLTSPEKSEPVRFSDRTKQSMLDAAETEGEAYAVAPGGTGIDQVVPIRKSAGALLLLRFSPDANGSARPGGDAPLPVLDDQVASQGVPIRQARGLRVAIAGDTGGRQELSMLAFGLMLLCVAALAWHGRRQRRHQRALEDQVEIAASATAQARLAEQEAQAARKRTETVNEELQEAIDFRRDIQDAAPVGLRVVDAQGKITAVNKAFLEASGMTSKALVGCMPPYPFWPVEARAERQMHLDEILAGRFAETGYRVEFMRTNDTRWLAQVRAVRLNSGQGWLLTSEDITEGERRQQQIERLSKELQRHDDFHLIGQRASTVAHQVRSHTAAISQCAWNIRTLARPMIGSPIDVELTGVDNEIIKQHGLLDQIIQQLKGETPPEHCGLADVVEDAFTLVSGESTRCNVRLVNLVQKNLEPQLLTRVNLMHVLANVIGNSVQSMAGTSVPNRQIVVNALIVKAAPIPGHPTDKEWMHLTVTDRGRGIDVDKWKTIFQDGWTDRPDGRGLGLYLCRLLVEQMGGSIDVKASSAAEGTVMRIVLPYKSTSGSSDESA